MISKVLEISTAHLLPDLDFMLQQSPLLRKNLGIEALTIGWLVRVPNDDQLVSVIFDPEFSKNYNDLMDYARQEGLQFILLDPDAPQLESLLTYEWP